MLGRLVNEYGHDSSLYQRFATSYRQSFGKSLKYHAEPDALKDPIARHEVEGLNPHDFVESGMSRLVKSAYQNELISHSRLGAAEANRILETLDSRTEA